MGEEIERKFLVKDNFTPEDYSIKKTIKIEQGYITLDKEKLVRVRIVNNNKSLLTIKGRKTELTRFEFEYTIPYSEGKELINEIVYNPIIIKTRYIIESNGYEWEIDYFSGENKGLILAEVELDHENENLNRPGFLSKEVTDDKKYYNYNLVKDPYSEWNN